jgi:Asp-tRNA(Asn)/Glu-tRNA(Gln) amidotransferase A subunit family amidase
MDLATETRLCTLPAHAMAQALVDHRISSVDLLEALARGEHWGQLHGVPLTLKDGIDVAGLRTTLGVAAFDRIADVDATSISVDGAPAAYFGQTAPLVMANIAGLPARSLRPAAMRMVCRSGCRVGPHWSEPRLIAIARALEAARISPGFQAPPMRA